MHFPVKNIDQDTDSRVGRPAGKRSPELASAVTTHGVPLKPMVLAASIALLVLAAAPALAEHRDDPDRAVGREERARDAGERQIRREDDPDRAVREAEHEERERDREPSRVRERDLD